MSKHRSKKISSYLSQFLKVLTKPQKNYFLIYLTGLIWLVKFRSIREIASHFGKGQTDGLHHFIKNAPHIVEQLAQELREFCKARLQDTSDALLILDDTVTERNGKHIEASFLHYTTKGLVVGLCAVTALIKTGTSVFVFAISGYCPKSVSQPGAFKSKVDLALEILNEAFLLFPKGMTVVMDTWYTCAPILNPIQEAGWVFVAAVKQNRYVYCDRVKISVSLLAKKRTSLKTVKLGKKRYQVTSWTVWLPGVGQVKLFITRLKQQTRFFVTNKLDLTESEMVKTYLQRFAIEVFHKDIKQHLGFGELFMRSWNGVQTHWMLLAIAYNLVALSSKPRLKSFRQKIRHFRNTVDYHRILNQKT